MQFCVAGAICGRPEGLECWRVSIDAPRIVNEVSYVTGINHESQEKR